MEQITLVSKRFRDQKEKPIDRAVWWLDWAVRNPDASHIRSPVLTLGSIQANSYDIILVEFLIIIFITYYFTKCLMKQKLKTNATKDKKI
jgi:glucuronosyltransferase